MASACGPVTTLIGWYWVRESKIDRKMPGSKLVGAFLTHLETVRGNSIRTRNNRLAAIHSLSPLPSLKTKRVTPHVLRHTNAMLLRANDVDISTIALWLGHQSIKTTQIYQHADPALKERAIARTPARHQTRPINRQAARLPRRPLIMPGRPTRKAVKQQEHRPSDDHSA